MPIHHKHSFLAYMFMPGLLLTDAHADKKSEKEAFKLAEFQLKEKDKKDEILAEIAAGGMPDLNASKTSNAISAAAPIINSVASIFGGGTKKNNPNMMYIVIGGIVLVLFIFMGKRK